MRHLREKDYKQPKEMDLFSVPKIPGEQCPCPKFPMTRASNCTITLAEERYDPGMLIIQAVLFPLSFLLLALFVYGLVTKGRSNNFLRWVYILGCLAASANSINLVDPFGARGVFPPIFVWLLNDLAIVALFSLLASITFNIHSVWTGRMRRSLRVGITGMSATAKAAFLILHLVFSGLFFGLTFAGFLDPSHLNVYYACRSVIGATMIIALVIMCYQDTRAVLASISGKFIKSLLRGSGPYGDHKARLLRTRMIRVCICGVLDGGLLALLGVLYAVCDDSCLSVPGSTTSAIGMLLGWRTVIMGTLLVVCINFPVMDMERCRTRSRPTLASRETPGPPTISTAHSSMDARTKSRKSSSGLPTVPEGSEDQPLLLNNDGQSGDSAMNSSSFDEILRHSMVE